MKIFCNMCERELGEIKKAEDKYTKVKVIKFVPKFKEHAGKILFNPTTKTLKIDPEACPHCFKSLVKEQAIKAITTMADKLIEQPAAYYIPEKDDEVKYTELHCSICGELQFETPSGLTCVNGHGGAESQEDLE